MTTPGPAPHRIEVTRVMCASVWRLEGSPMSHLLRIRNEVMPHSSPAAAKYGVLYTSGWSIVWVEGREEVIDRALERAAAELRASQQDTLHRSRGPASLSERIVVAATQTPLSSTDFSRWVVHMREEGPSLEPRDIWNRLGAPCLIDPSNRPGTRPLQQFALVAADDQGPVDQLRALSERFRSPTVYQRFGVAQLRSPDMGTAYVDIPVRGGAARVRVLSGRSMARAAVRNTMPHVDGIVMLVGKSPTATIELATHIAQAVQRSADPPRIWLGGETEPAAACARLFENFGVAARIIPEAPGRDLLPLLGAVGLQPFTA